jgi:hypothetical protein
MPSIALYFTALQLLQWLVVPFSHYAFDNVRSLEERTWWRALADYLI